MGKEGSLLERTMVARQLLKIRAHERERDASYVDGWDRDLLEYIKWLGGISIFLRYAEQLDGQRLVLDIGSGTNKGITEIARSKLGRNLNFVGTNLSRVPESLGNTDPVRTVRTSAEVLRGIEDESVNGIIALASIAYSDSPSMVASSLNRVLAPGGVIKSFFRPIGREDEFSDEYNYKTHYRFSAAFLALGYDVAVRVGIDEDLMVAVKPGETQPKFGASGLLNADSSFMDQLLVYEGHI